MHEVGTRILQALATVDDERRRRTLDPALDRAVTTLKRYQQQRFARTHADLLAHPRFGRAARFFLDELYGPQDFTRRDAQFGRIVPALVRLFPQDIVSTVESLSAVHALSEQLDSAMAAHLAGGAITPAHYVHAWRAAGLAAERSRQLDLVLVVGTALERHTRSFVLRASLRAMRGPARTAGLGTLQNFLESGFDAFGAMRGAREFLGLIEQRERALAAQLFAPAPGGDSAFSAPTGELLAQLP